MKYSEDGITYDEIYIKALDSMPIGSIISFAGENIPTGWLVCDGDVVSSTDYPDLFAEIGNKYGGTSPSFKLPDLRGRVPVGLDPTDHLEEFDTLGNSGGERTHTLTSNENANINLKLGASNQQSSWANRAFYDGMVPVYHDAANQYWDANLDYKVQPHNNLQPYLVVNFIIKATNTTPTMASVVNATNDSTEDAYSCDYMNKKLGGTVLYESASGTSGDIALSDNISNYKYIELYAINKDDTNEMLGIYKYDTTQSIFVLSGCSVSSTSFNIFNKKYTKGTNTLTAGTCKLYSGGSGRVSDYEVYIITKVIGYK